MADRTSAEIFANIFCYLAEENTERDRKMAVYIWKQLFNYDFSPDQMGVDSELVRLGLALDTVDGIKYKD